MGRTRRIAIFLLVSLPISSCALHAADTSVVTAPTNPYKTKAGEPNAPLADFEVFGRLPGAPPLREKTANLRPQPETPIAPPLRSSSLPASLPNKPASQIEALDLPMSSHR